MRHQFTKEERQRGGKAAMAKMRESGKSHQLTDQDRFYGGFNMSLKVLAGKAKRHKLTPEDRRKGGLKRQAQLREARAPSLLPSLKLGLASLLVPHEKAQSAAPIPFGAKLKLEGPPPEQDPEDVDAAMADPDPLGLDLEPKPEPPELGGYCAQDVVAGPDPFTRSALRRFLLGPKTSFELKRSEREHLPILRAGGWIQEDSGLISLTEKGRLAVGMGG